MLRNCRSWLRERFFTCVPQLLKGKTSFAYLDMATAVSACVKIYDKHIWRKHGDGASMGMGALKGKRLVIAGSRKTEEMSAIIEKQGGTSVVRSLQGMTLLDEETLEAPLRQFAVEGADWVILTTGIGSETLASNAEKLNIQEPFLEQLSQASIASRGYKTTAYLKRAGLKAVVADDDGTVQNLIDKLEEFDFAGQRIVIQLHGEPSPELERFFAAKKRVRLFRCCPTNMFRPR